MKNSFFQNNQTPNNNSQQYPPQGQPYPMPGFPTQTYSQPYFQHNYLHYPLSNPLSSQQNQPFIQNYSYPQYKTPIYTQHYNSQQYPPQGQPYPMPGFPTQYFPMSSQPPYMQSQFLQQQQPPPQQQQQNIQSSYNSQLLSWDLPKNEEKEPMLLLDTTGSMNYGTSEIDQTPRRDTIREAIGIIVSTLEKEDSQAIHEQEEEGGGLRTITFAGGKAIDIGDLNTRNLREKWLKIHWSGGTQIMPGWNKLLDVYLEEFGGINPEERPLLMALIITDGDADDSEQFAKALQQVSNRIYVVLAIIGYGPDHDNALNTYKMIQENNYHVKVLEFGSETNPQTIAQTLLKMVE